MRLDEFNALPWHDAAILEIRVDRRRPGHIDEVCIRMRWPEERESTVIFGDCYALNAQMNFGVDAPETVRGAVAVAESPALVELRATWSTIGVDLTDVCCFTLETNSTASQFQVLARTAREEPA